MLPSSSAWLDGIRPVVQARFHRLDQRFRGEQQKILLERIGQDLGPQGVVDERLLARENLLVSRGEGVEQVVQVAVAHIEDARARARGRSR